MIEKRFKEFPMSVPPLSVRFCTRLFAPLRAMTSRRVALACAAALALGACAQPWQRFQAGDDASTLIAKLGPPKEVYSVAHGGKRLMWPTQPFGETTTAADVDASGRVLNVRQVLQVSEFYKAEVGKWTRDDVQVNFGKPERTAYFPLMKREVWSYRYQEDGVWYMLFHFYFDANGVLRLTQKSLDPLHDPGRHGR
jgi:hypothetical protein